MSRSEFVGGIGLFMFGMLQFEQAIKQLGGKAIKRLLQTYTDKVRKGIIMGTGMTALAQSSTVVSLIVTGFVGAGLLSLHSAMGVIVGANLGSTITPWMVVLLGFKTDIFLISFYLLGIGAVGLMCSDEYGKRYAFRKLMFGFGLMFLGLHFLKEAVEIMTTQVDIGIFQGIGTGLAILMGFVMATLMQTTAAVSVVTLAALQVNLISFDLAVGIMIGSNVGSAFTTALMGFLSGSGQSRSKKQLMIGHLLFNIITASLVIILLPLLLQATGRIAKDMGDVVALAVFHTLFNVLGVVFLSRFIGHYTRRISRVLPVSSPGITLAVREVATHMPEEVLVALSRDAQLLREHVYEFIKKCFGFNYVTQDDAPVHTDTSWRGRVRSRTEKRVLRRLPIHLTTEQDEKTLQYHPEGMHERIREYQHIKRIESGLYNFILHLSKREFINGSVHKLSILEEEIDSLLDAAKIIKENMHHIEHISDMNNTRVVAYRTGICEAVQDTIGSSPEPVSVENAEPDDLLYGFLQEHILAQDDSKSTPEEELSEEDIAEIVKTNRHIQHVISLLRTSNSSGIMQP